LRLKAKIRSIEILLRKALPDLSAVEMKHEGVAPYALIPDTIQEVTDWQSAFKPKVEH
jgi:hypothetical protein